MKAEIIGVKLKRAYIVCEPADVEQDEAWGRDAATFRVMSFVDAFDGPVYFSTPDKAVDAYVKWESSGRDSAEDIRSAVRRIIISEVWISEDVAFGDEN